MTLMSSCKVKAQKEFKFKFIDKIDSASIPSSNLFVDYRDDNKVSWKRDGDFLKIDLVTYDIYEFNFSKDVKVENDSIYLSYKRHETQRVIDKKGYVQFSYRVKVKEIKDYKIFFVYPNTYPGLKEK